MPDVPVPEVDSLFPSGKWVGFFTDNRVPGKHGMELNLEFRDSVMTGEGRDIVGNFTVNGVYRLDDGSCNFKKTYAGSHAILYSGFNEGKGIWGTWELQGVKGGFHIWPEGMGESTQNVLEEEAPIKFEEETGSAIEERELVPAGG